MPDLDVLPDTQSLTALGDRRRDVRYLCRIKARYDVEEQSKPAGRDDGWHVAEAIDISASGVALLLRRHLVPGTLLSISPVIPSWKHGWVLTVKVTNLRPGPNFTWCAGCKFMEALTDGQLRVFLHNSQSA
jgi:hypothetical protein